MNTALQRKKTAVQFLGRFLSTFCGCPPHPPITMYRVLRGKSKQPETAVQRNEKLQCNFWADCCPLLWAATKKLQCNFLVGRRNNRKTALQLLGFGVGTFMGGHSEALEPKPGLGLSPTCTQLDPGKAWVPPGFGPSPEPSLGPRPGVARSALHSRS